MADSPRVTLRRPWPDDAGAVAEALSDWQVTQWLRVAPWPYGLADAEAFLAGAGLDESAIRVDGQTVGMVRAGPTFGIWLATPWQRAGIGLRASVIALSRRFMAGARRIEASHLEGNHRSAELLARLGFREKGQTTLWSTPQGRHLPARMMSLTPGDFAARHAIVLNTPRLLIDGFRPADLPALQAILAQPDVARMFPGGAQPGVEMTATDFADLRITPPMRLVVRYEGQVIGSVGLLDTKPWQLTGFLEPGLAGQGLGQEMLDAFLEEVCLRFDPPELQTQVFLDNAAARRLLKNLGFQRDEDRVLASAARPDPAPGTTYRWRRPQGG